MNLAQLGNERLGHSIGKVSFFEITGENTAIPYAGPGDQDGAMRLLTKAYEQRSAEMPQLKVEPFSENLRSDPRFQDLVRRMTSRSEPWKQVAVCERVTFTASQR